MGKIEPPCEGQVVPKSHIAAVCYIISVVNSFVFIQSFVLVALAPMFLHATITGENGLIRNRHNERVYQITYCKQNKGRRKNKVLTAKIDTKRSDRAV